MKTPYKVTIEITSTGWSTKVMAKDGSVISERPFKLTSTGARAEKQGDWFDDFTEDDLELATSLEDEDLMGVARFLNFVN